MILTVYLSSRLKRLFFIIIFFKALTATAQFHYGLRAGGQLVTIQQNESTDLAWRPSYHGGLFFGYQVSLKFSVVADLLYSDKGYRVKADDRNFNAHMHYLSTPLMLQYKLTDKLSVLAGAEFSLHLGRHGFANGYNYTKFADYGYLMHGWGGGLAYQVDPRLNVMARYFQDATDIATRYDRTMAAVAGNSKTIQLSIGYFYQREEDEVFKSERWKTFSVGFRQGVSKYVLKRNEYYQNDGKSEASSGRVGYLAEFDFRASRKNVYTSIGIAYSQKGGIIPGEDLPEIKQDFLTIPLVFGYSPLRTKWLTFSMEAGLAYNHLLSSKNRPDVEGNEGSTKDDITSAMYGFELSTNAFDKVIPFVGYRKDIDLANFVDYASGTELSHKGRILSFGVRIKGAEYSKKQFKAYRARVDSIAPRFAFGIKAGINLNNTTHDEPIDGQKDHSKSMLAGHFGFYFQFRLYERLSLSPELMYIRKGLRFDYDGMERKAKGDFIEIPFLFSYKINNKIAVDAGPVIGVMLNSTVSPMPDYGYDNYWWYGDNMEVENGIVVGGRYQLMERISLGLRYYRGFSDMSSVNYGDDNTNEYNTNVQLFTAFRIK